MLANQSRISMNFVEPKRSLQFSQEPPLILIISLMYAVHTRPSYSWRPVSMVPSCLRLGLPRGSFPSSFLPKHTLYIFSLVRDIPLTSSSLICSTLVAIEKESKGISCALAYTVLFQVLSSTKTLAEAAAFVYLLQFVQDHVSFTSDLRSISIFVFFFI